MRTRYLPLTLSLLVFFSATPVQAQFRDLKRSCSRATVHGQGVHWLKQCLQTVFTMHPIHPTLGSIAPSSGIGVGATLSSMPRSGRIEYPTAATILRSTNGSLLGRVAMTIAIPPLSFVRIDDPDTATDDNGIPATESNAGYHSNRTDLRPAHDHGTHLELIRDYWKVDEKASFRIQGEWRDLTRQDFYGIGQDTTQNGLARYAIRQDKINFDVNDPLTSWAEIGMGFSTFRPIVRDAVSDRPTLSTLYRATSTPGIELTTTFLAVTPTVRFRLPVQNRHLRHTEIKMSYSINHALHAALSFERARVTVRSEHELRLPVHKTSVNRSTTANFACPNLRSQEHCTAGTIVLTAQVSTTTTHGGNQVPFYLQDTLGGTDEAGNDTLRGFRDSRFRAPNRVFLQAEYRHRLWGPLTALAFYDAGKVTSTSVNFHHLQHTAGVGLDLTASSQIILRTYIGFGTREGTRPNVKFGGL